MKTLLLFIGLFSLQIFSFFSLGGNMGFLHNLGNQKGNGKILGTSCENLFFLFFILFLWMMTCCWFCGYLWFHNFPCMSHLSCKGDWIWSLGFHLCNTCCCYVGIQMVYDSDSSPGMTIDQLLVTLVTPYIICVSSLLKWVKMSGGQNIIHELFLFCNFGKECHYH